MGIFVGASQSVQAVDAVNELGRTDLMNYVVATQDKIVEIQQDIDRLWHECYTTVTVRSGYGRYLSVHVEVRRRASCTDDDIKSHKQREKDLITFKEELFTNIALLVVEAEENNLLDARDNEGMTTLNLCTNQSIYNKLRELGVPFQYDAFMYNYRGELIISSTILTVIVIALYKNGYLTQDAFVHLSENVKSGAITTLEGLKSSVKRCVEYPLESTQYAFEKIIDGIYHTTVFVWNVACSAVLEVSY